MMPGIGTQPTEFSRATVAVATDASLAAAIRLAVNSIPVAEEMAGEGPVELLANLPGSPIVRDHLVHEVASTLRAQLPQAEVVVRGGVGAPKHLVRAWTDVPTPPGANRFETIRVPAWWRNSTRRCLLCRGPGQARSPADRPLYRLAALAHPRQRLAARLSPDHAALVAELASPWQPRLILLAARWESRQLVVATRDVITAELVWLALAERGPFPDGIGPWEDPAVQRATMLELGISGPHELRLVATPDDGRSPLLAHLGRRLGITS